MARPLVVLAAVVLLVVAGLLVAVPLAISRQLSPEGVARRASELAGRPVGVERVALAFRPGLRIRAEGITVGGEAAAEAVEVEIALAPLLRRRIEPAELHLVGARIPVARTPEGGFRVALLDRPGGEAGGVPPLLPALDARDGEIFLVEADGTRTDAPVLRIERLELAPLAHGGRAPLRLEGALAAAPDSRWSFGHARLEGALSLREGAPALESGRVEGRDVRVRGLRIERVQGSFAYAAGVVTIEALDFSAYGGTGSASGSLRLGRPSRFDGELRVAGAALADLIADWRGQPFTGEPGLLTADARLALPFSSLAAGTGQGRVTLRDGRIPASSLFDTLLGSIGRLTGRLLSVGSTTAPAPSRLETLGAGFALRDGRLRSEDLELVTDDYRWRARGSLGLDQSLDFTGPLQLTSRGLQRMLASGALPLPAATAVIPEIPLRVTGTLGKASLSADAVGLPAAARGTLVGLVRGGGSLVEGAARGGESAVKGAARGLGRVTDKVLGREPEPSED